MILMIILGTSFALLIHLGIKHSASNIANDLTSNHISLIFSLGVIFCWKLAKQIWFWRRNRKALALAEKINGFKDLTESDAKQRDSFIKEGVLSPMPHVYYKNRQYLLVQINAAAKPLHH